MDRRPRHRDGDPQPQPGEPHEIRAGAPLGRLRLRAEARPQHLSARLVDRHADAHNGRHHRVQRGACREGLALRPGHLCGRRGDARRPLGAGIQIGPRDGSARQPRARSRHLHGQIPARRGAVSRRCGGGDRGESRLSERAGAGRLSPRQRDAGISAGRHLHRPRLERAHSAEHRLCLRAGDQGAADAARRAAARRGLCPLIRPWICLISPKDQLGAAANLLYQDRAGAQPEGGSGSVNGFFRKVARLAVSKMAAFCYAVAVGVAGNLVFNYVQTHQAAPSIAALPHEAPAPAEKSPTVVPATTPSVMPAAAMIAKPPAAAPDRAAKPATVSAPVAPPVPPLPDPSANLGLPSAAALSAPPLKPTALPSPAPAAIAAPDRARPPAEAAAAAEANAKPAPAAALPPLGPAIEVASPPGAPAAPSTPIALLPDPKPASPEAADKPPPIKPGPGSGGLY